MGGERWEVGGERWEVEGGRWKVEGGRWEVGGGRWEVEGGRWEVGVGSVLGLCWGVRGKVSRGRWGCCERWSWGEGSVRGCEGLGLKWGKMEGDGGRWSWAKWRCWEWKVGGEIGGN